MSNHFTGWEYLRLGRSSEGEHWRCEPESTRVRSIRRTQRNHGEDVLVCKRRDVLFLLVPSVERFLLFGGSDGGPVPECEVYDPKVNASSRIADMVEPRSLHHVSLPRGKFCLRGTTVWP